eukprot:gb/GFBE01036862.1/.p1 GENE.gb/GFBE01036862.1/~~gb/GFBE01036862.1/.p1  ORF type:complete len:478 (+),score=67.80 gb/GFBE01036862.1/:1-1434(+)
MQLFATLAALAMFAQIHLEVVSAAAGGSGKLVRSEMKDIKAHVRADGTVEADGASHMESVEHMDVRTEPASAEGVCEAGSYELADLIYKPEKSFCLSYGWYTCSSQWRAISDNCFGGMTAGSGMFQGRSFPKNPPYLVWDLGSVTSVSSMVYTTCRPPGFTDGRVSMFKLFLSNDTVTWRLFLTGNPEEHPAVGSRTTYKVHPLSMSAVGPGRYLKWESVANHGNNNYMWIEEPRFCSPRVATTTATTTRATTTSTTPRATATSPGTTQDLQGRYRFLENQVFLDNMPYVWEKLSGPTVFRTGWKKWTFRYGRREFAVSVEDWTGMSIENATEQLHRFPPEYTKAFEIVSESGKDGVSWKDLKCGCCAHGSQNYLNLMPCMHDSAGVIAHEAGHVIEQRARSHESDILDRWASAIQEDVIMVSGYGSQNAWEDAAEFSKIYYWCMGGGKLSELATLSPKRYALWEHMLELSGAMRND